jgi:hypothetical protein
MALPRAFVGFSSTDIHCYRMMCAWKAHENIDFNFADFQLYDAVDSSNERYIKQRCREKIQLSDTYVLLIGNDTHTKTRYVKWEVEVAREKGCRLIDVNLNHSRFPDLLCPWFFCDLGALFVPFSSRIVAAALEPWIRPAFPPSNTSNWRFVDEFYVSLGYQLVGSGAILPTPVNPFMFGKPAWAK